MVPSHSLESGAHRILCKVRLKLPQPGRENQPCVGLGARCFGQLIIYVRQTFRLASQLIEV